MVVEMVTSLGTLVECFFFFLFNCENVCYAYAFAFSTSNSLKFTTEMDILLDAWHKL